MFSICMPNQLIQRVRWSTLMTLKPLVGEVREPIPAKPGRQRRYDDHYKRNGSANLFVFLDRHCRWRHVEVTKRKTNADFSACMKALVDVHYPDAEVIRVVMDNLSTHTESALYQTFEPAEARRILRRLELHYTPVHASWLNMVEIEISVLARQCLDRRIGDIETLAKEVAAWEVRRNQEGATIEWLLNLDKARTKLSKAYPNLSCSMCRGTIRRMAFQQGSRAAALHIEEAS